MSGLLLGMVLSVSTCWFHSMVTLPPWPYYYYHYYYRRISPFSALAGKYSHILGYNNQHV
jgi:hypothetical protein